VEFALADYGLSIDRAHIRISCTPNPQHCLTRRGFVTVTVQDSVSLPLAPSFLGSGPLSIPVRAASTEQVSRFWTAG
jgi:hypothetical protein